MVKISGLSQQQKLAFLRQLININSANGNELAVAQLVKNFLATFGIKATIDEFADAFGKKRANLWATVGTLTATKHVVLSGHMDTVATDATKWHHQPWAADGSTSKIFGLGAADMKSGLAALVLTLVAAQQMALDYRLSLVLTAGEEFGAIGSKRLVAQKQFSDVDAIIIGEASDEQVYFAHAGSLNYRIESLGKAAHSSTPQAGINAISGLLAFVNQEQTLFADAACDPILGAVQHSITKITGGKQVNTIPATAELWGNIRPTKACDNDDVIAKLTDTVAKINQTTDYNLKLTIVHNFAPVATAVDDRLVKLAQNAAVRFGSCETAGKLAIMNGATDASVFCLQAKAASVIVLGAAMAKTAHQVDEFTTVASFLALEKIYCDIISRF